MDFFGFLAISPERKELPEIRWCQNHQIFKGFSDFQKWIFEFWIYGFLNFFFISGHISGTKRATGDPLVSNNRIFKKMKFFGFWISGYISATQKSYRRSAGVKTTRFLRGSHGLSAQWGAKDEVKQLGPGSFIFCLF